MKKAILITIALLGVQSMPAHAREIPEVRRFMTDEIKKIAVGLRDSDGNMESPRPGPVGNGFAELAVFRLRIKAGFGFDVFFGRLTLEPQIELYWQQ